MTVLDDGWHQVPEMVMLSNETFDRLTVTQVVGTLPGTRPQDACHNWKERP
jgi:hypothetical protein